MKSALPPAPAAGLPSTTLNLSPLPSLPELVPDGVDVYFDNVGGDRLEAALDVMNRGGRLGLELYGHQIVRRGQLTDSAVTVHIYLLGFSLYDAVLVKVDTLVGLPVVGAVVN